MTLDDNSDGFLTLDELRIGLEQAEAGYKRTKSDADLRSIVEGMDVDGSGRVDYTEFIAAALDKRSYLSEQACWTAFTVFDLNGDGKISMCELSQVLDGDASGKSSGAAELLKGMDLNGDGMIDFPEFMAMMAAPADASDAKAEKKRAESVCEGEANAGKWKDGTPERGGRTPKRGGA